MKVTAKRIIGFILSLPVFAVYWYGFTHLKTIDILIPASIASGGGFLLLGAIWLFRYSGKREVNR